MPAPKGYVTKRKSRRPLDVQETNSTPGTPSAQRLNNNHHIAQDSDSDSAAGFDSQWKR